MKESQDPMIPRKMELDKNPHGTELKISQQKHFMECGKGIWMNEENADCIEKICEELK